MDLPSNQTLLARNPPNYKDLELKIIELHEDVAMLDSWRECKIIATP